MEQNDKLNRQDVEDIMGLSPMQEGMLFHYLADPNSQQYCEQYSFRLNGALAAIPFETVWNSVAETNEMLRTVYRWKNLDNPVQIVLKKRPINIEYDDLSTLSVEERQRKLMEIKVKDRQKGFELEHGPLLRIILLKTGQDQHEMVISNHHILFDGWSYMLILKEFLQTYHSIVKGLAPSTGFKPKYKEYLKWIRSAAQNQAANYWKDYLKGYGHKLLLPVDDLNDGGGTAAKNLSCRLNQNLTGKIKKLARELEVTLGTIFISGWGLLLQHNNRTNDVVFGVTVSGRANINLKGIENIVGLMINTLPVRVQCEKDETIRGLLKKTGRNTENRQNYELTPLANIMSYAETNTQGKLFDNIVVIENYPFDELNRMNTDLKIDGYSGFGFTNYDLTLSVNLFDQIEINFIYNTRVFEESTIELMLSRYLVILEEMERDINGQCRAIDYLTAEEKQLRRFEPVEFDYDCLSGTV